MVLHQIIFKFLPLELRCQPLMVAFQISFLPQVKSDKRRKQMQLLYSWRFSRHSAPLHWLVHCHMTCDNETVSRQKPWAGNIICENYDVKRETVHCYPQNVDRCSTWSERAVEGGLMLSQESHRVFSKFAFVLLCFITNHLITGPLGNSEFCFPRLRLGKHWDSWETKFTVPLGTSH